MLKLNTIEFVLLLSIMKNADEQQSLKVASKSLRICLNQLAVFNLNCSSVEIIRLNKIFNISE